MIRRSLPWVVVTSRSSDIRPTSGCSNVFLLAERAAAGAGADLPKPAGGEAGRPTAGATAHEAAAAELAEEEAKEEAAEEAAEDALEAAADAEASLDLPARLAKTAAAGKTKARPERHAAHASCFSLPPSE